MNRARQLEQLRAAWPEMCAMHAARAAARVEVLPRVEAMREIVERIAVKVEADRMVCVEVAGDLLRLRRQLGWFKRVFGEAREKNSPET